MFGGKVGRYLPMPIRQVARKLHGAAILERGRKLGSRPRGETPEEPLGVLGLYRSVLGLGQGARLFLRACEAAGFAHHPIDVTSFFSLDQTLAPPVGTSEAMPARTGALIAHLNPVELQYLIGRLGRQLPLQAYRIGYWAWETTQIPADWLPGAGLVDEVWCPSRFTADALRASLGPDKPIHVLPHPVFEPPSGRSDKAFFGLDPARTTLFCALDLKSSVARKNPFGVLEAFARSGVGARGEAQLLVKVHGARPDGFQPDGLMASLATTPGVVLLEERLQSDDMALLLASVDIVLSAHRSEGFGLVLAEAMAAGKAVIATGWSGNVDFMTETSAALVRSRLIPVHDPDGIYHGGLWAEPDIDHMAVLIADLVSDPERRARLGAAAQQHILQAFGIAAWRARLSDLLAVRQAAA